MELECAEVGLRLNAKKTEVMTYNIPQEHLPLTSTEGAALKEVTDFKYLGAWVGATEKDVKVRKALAWRALNGMTSVWKSSLPRHIKISFFSATVESVLLYGCECWTLTQALQKSLDGCYTKMPPGTPSQKARTVGTNTRASIERTSHIYLCGRTKEGRWCREHQ